MADTAGAVPLLLAMGDTSKSWAPPPPERGTQKDDAASNESRQVENRGSIGGFTEASMSGEVLLLNY